MRPVGPGTGDGVIHITNGTLSQRVTFTNLEPVIDTVTGDSLTIAGTESDNTFTFTQGLDASRGKVAVDAFETIEFGNKGTLKLGGAGGNDSFDIQHTSAAAGLAGIEIAGTAQGNDSVTIQTNSQDVNVSSGRIDIGAQTLVTHTNVNSVGLGAVDALTVSGDDNANTLVLTPTSTDAAGFAQDNGPAFTVQSLQSFSYEGRAGNDQATLSGSTQLSPTNGVSLDGGDGTDTLSGHPIDTTWTINQANRGTANAISFAGFENLIGSTANDNFQVADGGSIESITGGAGENQLGYSARTAPVTVDLATLSSSGVNSFAAIDAIVGTEFSDTLIGPDQVNSWNILQNNAGDINGVTTFSGFENLTGNQQSDNFRFLDGASISGTLSGGAGSDTLDASAHTAPVNINLQSLTSSTAGSIASVEDLRAGTAGGTLTGPNTVNVWNVQSGGTGDLNSVFTFVGFDSLEGGTVQDVFHYHANNLDITDPHLGILPAPNGSVALHSMEELHVLDARAVQVGGGASNDVLNIQTTGPTDFTYSLNSGPQVELHRPDSFTFDALGGDDSFLFDHAQSGLLQVPGSIHVRGGDGQDIVTLAGTGGSDWHEVFSYGDPDLLAIHQGNASLGFSFVSIENIHDSIPVAELSILGTPASETITYTQGHTADFGAVFTDNRARFDFSNKQKLLLRAGAGDDVFVIDNATNPVGLIEIQAEGEEGNDEIRILAVLNVPTTSFNAESVVDTTLPQEIEEEAEEETSENEEESSDESTDEESSDDTEQDQEEDTGSETDESDSESQTEDDTETSEETTDEETSDGTEQDQEQDAGSETGESDSESQTDGTEEEASDESESEENAGDSGSETQSEESETDGNAEPADEEAVEENDPSPEPIADPEEPQTPEPVSDNTPQRPEEILPAPRPQIPEPLPEELSDEQTETPVTQDRRRELIRAETSNVEELRGVQFSRSQLEALILFRPSPHQSEANNTATFEEAGFAEERAFGPDGDLQPKPLSETERAAEPERETVTDTEIAADTKEPDEEDDSEPEERKKADQPDSELSFNLDRVESKGFRITPSLLISNQESGTPTQN